MHVIACNGIYYIVLQIHYMSLHRGGFADDPVAAQKAEKFLQRLVYIGTRNAESLSARAGSVRDVDNGNGGSERAGPPSGGQVRSIRKNIVLPGSGPTDLHYGKKVTFHCESSLSVLPSDHFDTAIAISGPSLRLLILERKFA